MAAEPFSVTCSLRVLSSLWRDESRAERMVHRDAPRAAVHTGATRTIASSNSSISPTRSYEEEGIAGCLPGVVAWYAHGGTIEIPARGRSPKVEDPWRGHRRPLCRGWELIASVHLRAHNARSERHAHAPVGQAQGE